MNIFLLISLVLAIIILILTVILLSSVIVSSKADKDAEKYFDDLLEKLKNNDDLD